MTSAPDHHHAGSITRALAKVAVAAGALGGLVLFWRRRRPAGSGSGRRDGGGGLAGVREPRRPVPPTLVDAVAAHPED